MAFPTEETGEAENSLKVEFEMTRTIFRRIRACTGMPISVPGFLRSMQPNRRHPIASRDRRVINGAHS